MRLRSSQFVFLLLIACSVQIREKHALRLVDQAISGNSVRMLPFREAGFQAGQAEIHPGQLTFRRPQLGLLPAACTARREPWTVRRPVADSTAIAVHTGLIRTKGCAPLSSRLS